MNLLIVDDEPLARAELIRLFGEMLPRFHGVEASSLAEARSALLGGDFEAAFVDIELGGSSGLEFIPDAAAAGTPVVIVTAHDRYAVQAFDGGALDYLLKPIESSRLYRSIARISRNKRPAPQDLLILNDQTNCWPVRPADIILVEAEGSYTAVKFTDRKPLVVCHSLKEIELLLEPHSFVRANRSQLVNLQRLQVIHREASGRMIGTLDGHGTIEFSRRQAKALRSRFAL
jgi:two-component system, LytTR family, response regulator